MKFKRYLILLSVLLVLIILGVVWAEHDTEAKNQAHYDKAKTSCPTNIWLVYEDLGMVISNDPIRKPYPEKVAAITGSHVYGYGCTIEEAGHVREKLPNY